MEKRAGCGENPDPAAQRHAFVRSAGIGGLRDYCTFFGAAAGAAGVPTILAETM